MIDRRRLVSGMVIVTAATLTQSAPTKAQVNGTADVQVTLSVEMPPQPPIGATLMDRTVAVVRNRAEMIPGVIVSAEATPEGTIVMNLKGVDEVDSVLKTITSRGWVELVDTFGDFPEAGSIVRTTSSEAPWVEANGTPVAAPLKPVYETIVSSEDIVEVFMLIDQFEQTVIGFRLNSRAADAFEQFTGDHIGLPMAIVIDNQVISTPVMMAAISTEGQIQGLDQAAAQTLAIQLSLAPLPARVAVESLVVTPAATS